MMRFLYSKPAPGLLESPDEASSLKVRSKSEDDQAHLSDTVIGELANGPTKDFLHVLIHEGDKRGPQCRKYYVIQVPPKAMPGDTFYVIIEDVKYQVTCPQITKPGQKIVVTMERPAKFDHE
eukprot:gene26142-29531_t